MQERSASGSIDDVLAGALWVTGLTDPTLSMERLHETFLDVVFSFPGGSDAGGKEGGRDQLRLRTAAEVERERRERERLRQEAADLLGIGGDDGAYADEELDEEASDFADDELDENDQLAEDRAFLDWVDHTHHVAHPRDDKADAVSGSSPAVELELRRVGLGEAQEAAAADVLPERLKEIEMKEDRPRLGAKTLAGGYTYSISLELEAYWVLRQLRRTGQPLAHCTRVCALANRPLADIADEPVLAAISFALRKMTREHLEPAHLMIYYQTDLHPLLFALLDGSALMASAEHSIPVPSLAYSTLSGRRQRPILSETYVGFTDKSTASIGEGDPAWRDLFGTDYLVRKPCFIELGRLLVRILELDSLCHKFEYRRQQMLIMLRDVTEAHVQDQRTLLEHTVFEDAVEADLWHSFVQGLMNRRSRGAYHVVRALGLEEAYEEYTITALQYQENLLNNAAIHLCTRQSHMNLHAWAEQVGSVLSPPRQSEWVLALFNNAIVETFSSLPLLCKQVVDMFCSEGDLIVSYTTVQRKEDIFPLSSFFVDHPRHYTDLVQKERQGLVKLFYVVDEDLVRRVLNMNQLYQSVPPPETTDPSAPEMEWYRERETAMELLVYRLVDRLSAKVKSELLSQTVYQLDTIGVQRLSLFCAQGPYEPTRLAIDAFTPDTLTWEPEWNVVEALPRDPAGGGGGGGGGDIPVAVRPQARVCAVFQGDNGITSFAFIDENGAVIGSTRWTECAMNSALGRAAALMQNITLEKLFVQCTPSVIAVAASGAASFRLMRSIQDFVRDRVVPALGVAVDVVWATPDIARFSSETSYADQEMPSMDHVMRTSIALARFVQDPLTIVATLFDERHTIVRVLGTSVPGSITGRESQETFSRRVAWEMSLWVGATGFWLEDCVRRPNSLAVLQFVPGLGRSKARVLLQDVAKNPVTSRAVLEARLTDLFGNVVTHNALNAIRMAVPDGGEEHAESWHPLDQTLIPPAWYAVAEALVKEIVATGGGNSADIFGDDFGDTTDAAADESAVAAPLLQFFAKSMQDRRDCVAAATEKEDYIGKVCDVVRPRGIDSVPGNSEFLFLVDELVAGGQSFIRRPYRRISTRELMRGVTGVTFVSSADLQDIVQRGLVSSAVFSSSPAAAYDGSDGAAAALSFGQFDDVDVGSVESVVIKEGDYVTGTVTGIRGGLNQGVRLVTSRGLDAFIALDNIDDSSLRAEVEHHIQFLEAVREARVAGVPVSDRVPQNYETPARLRRGALIQGIATRCNWARCELHLRWCPAREAAFDVAKATGDGGKDSLYFPSSYASLAGAVVPGLGGSATLGGLRGNGVDAPRTFTTKIARHVLFRDFTNMQAQEELRDKEMGEMLLRPASGVRNGATCVVKLGQNCTASWVIREERRSNGNIFYVLREKLVNKVLAFDEVDEMLRDFMGAVVNLVRSVRRHRRFVQHLRDVRGALEDQQRAGGGSNVFAYCFAETGTMSKPPPLYRVFTSCGNRQYAFRLHFTNTAIYVRLPFGRSQSGGSGTADYRWVECGNAEQVSETVKNHARKSSSFF